MQDKIGKWTSAAQHMWWLIPALPLYDAIKVRAYSLTPALPLYDAIKGQGLWSCTTLPLYDAIKG